MFAVSSANSSGNRSGGKVGCNSPALHKTKKDTEEDTSMEFATPTYQLLYEVEMLGLYRKKPFWDLMRESDILEDILSNSKVVNANR